jgi:hypothetical protein
VIALCRKPLSGEDADTFEDEEKQADLDQQVINDSGYIEYTRNNMHQYYHVEEVLSMIDVSNDGVKKPASGNNNSSNPSMNMESKSDNSLFQSELMQINHISQLFIGLNVYSLLFFQLSGLINKDRIQSVLVLNGSDPHSIMAM